MTPFDPSASVAAGDQVIALHVPGDWLDLVLDDELELRRRILDTILPADREAVLTGLLAWRAQPGLLSHGVVDVHGDGVDIMWHVLSHAVPVPSDDDVDAAAVLARLLSSHVRDSHVSGSHVRDSHVEAFDTAQGRAVGLLQEQTVAGPDGAMPGGQDAGPLSSGLAAVLALPRGSRLGLLVVGVCLDPDQIHELAGLVTLVATRSTISAAPS